MRLRISQIRQFPKVDRHPFGHFIFAVFHSLEASACTLSVIFRLGLYRLDPENDLPGFTLYTIIQLLVKPNTQEC
jgi:hypothetical protein